jgi:hypothetical protein
MNEKQLQAQLTDLRKEYARLPMVVRLQGGAYFNKLHDLLEQLVIGARSETTTEKDGDRHG